MQNQVKLLQTVYMKVGLINIHVPYLYETILSDSKNTWHLELVKTVYICT